MKLSRRRWLGASVATLTGGLAVAGITLAQDKAEGGLMFELYRDAKEEFRWRLKSANGQIIATSGEGYKAKADCMKAVEAIRAGAAKAKVEDLTAKK